MVCSTSLHGWWKRLVRMRLILIPAVVLVVASGVVFIESQHGQSAQTFVLPAPTGPYAVGRMEEDWTDQSRTDLLAPQAGVKRELVVWVWYPSVRVPGAKVAPYLPTQWAQMSSQPGSDAIETHSVENAPLATALARYPVLIFEPGLGNMPTQYTTLLEDLASHGFIIFAITPTYSTDVVVFPNGRVADATPAGQPDNAPNPQAAGNRLVMIWAQDVIFVMNQLEQLNATTGSMWSQHLDLARLGVLGHSFGGATAAQVCQMDARCKAGIDLDGALFGDVVQTGLKKPFMVIQSDRGACSDAKCRSFQSEVQAILRPVPSGERYHLSIKNTAHFNFSDDAVTLPSAQALGALGSINGVRGLEITRAYVRAFFDTSLNGMPSPLFQGPSRAYPEVQFLTP